MGQEVTPKTGSEASQPGKDPIATKLGTGIEYIFGEKITVPEVTSQNWK